MRRECRKCNKYIWTHFLQMHKMEHTTQPAMEHNTMVKQLNIMNKWALAYQLLLELLLFGYLLLPLLLTLLVQ